MAVGISSRERDALVLTIGTPGAPGFRWRLCAPLPGVFRLQGSDLAGGFLDGGACEILAAQTGAVRPEPQALDLEERDGVTVRAIGDTAWLSLRADPFSLQVGRDQTASTLTVSGLGVEGNTTWLEGPLRSDERLYGTGERFNGANQRGKLVRVFAVDKWCQTEGNSYVPIPFVLSSAGWGLLVNRYESSELDLGATRPDRYRYSLDSASLDLYLFAPAAPAAILGSLSRLVGRTPLPATWTFGVHVCRHARLKEFGSREGVMSMVRAMDKNRLPWSSVILEGWDTYDASRYGELGGLVRELHAMGKKVLLYEGCGRMPAQHHAVQGAKPEYFVRSADGDTQVLEAAGYNPADAPGRRSVAFLDLTNPQAVRWWTEQVWGRLVGEIGVDGAKIDFCEQFPEWEGLRMSDGRSPRGMHHLYPVLYNTMMCGLYRRLRPEGGMCFSRGGSTGAHLYPYLWAGDQLREWRFLRAILSALLSAGLSGVPFLCHDLAAYMPAKDTAANQEDRVFARGTQMGCFTVNMQTHGIVTRPYDFPTPIVDLYRFYSRLHYALVPYLVEQARVSCATGLPLTRHLFLSWPEDTATWDVEDEYLLGADLLVAPVLEDAVERDLYLPAGSWESLFGLEVVEGPRTLTRYPAPLDQIPVFRRLDGVSHEAGAFVQEARRLAADRESR
jgi:alpha-D-xyloside xylohydrolase